MKELNNFSDVTLMMIWGMNQVNLILMPLILPVAQEATFTPLFILYPFYVLGQ